jgi:maltooligosyltrehalose trehalohydrolase
VSHRFAVWAPDARRVRLWLDGVVRDLDRDAGGWWRRDEPDAGPGSDYGYLLDDDETVLPDPRSPWQPVGVHGPSRLYDHAEFGWTDRRWTGRQLAGSVLYELHIGTFTEAGTFDAAIGRLDHLVDLGVDLVELLPVNSFNGSHNWGYDGVSWYAPQESYGGPDGLKRFVDAAHNKGLGVLLDVVHNHFGPSGAYAPRFGPYLSSGANTWGRSLNLDGPDSGEVRRYLLDNVLMWLRDYHLDGLRLDAVHALVDRGATHLLEEFAVEVDALSTRLNRPLSLIAESDLNDPRLVTARDGGGYGLTAQWDDDVHHALHAALTGERQGYYGDFGSLETLATVLRGAFFHAGTWSSFRRRKHGRPVDRARLPGYRFVVFLQNHDQIGNRATGDRLPATLSGRLLRVGAVLLFTGPFTPMLFMGEEWAASTPWQFFTSHPEPELAAAVGAGRRAEFAGHGWSGEVPDPQDPATFARSKLDWAELAQPAHAAMLALHRELIALRRSQPGLTDPRLDRVAVTVRASCLIVRRGDCLVLANFSPEPSTVELDAPELDAAELDAPESTGPEPAGAQPRVVLLATDPAVVLDGGTVTLPGHSATILSG